MVLHKDGNNDKRFHGPTTNIGEIRALVGNEQVDLILAQGPDLIRTHLDAFMQFESTLVGQLYDHMASAMPTR